MCLPDCDRKQKFEVHSTLTNAPCNYQLIGCTCHRMLTRAFWILMIIPHCLLYMMVMEVSGFGIAAMVCP